MARLLFNPMSWGRGMGPLMDCLYVAREASDLGHRVAFICRNRFADLTARYRYEVYLNASPPAPKTIDADLFNEDFPVFQGLGEEQWVRQILAHEFTAIEDFRPDAVFTWLQFTGVISALASGIPVASLARWPAHPEYTSPFLARGHKTVSRCTPLFNQILSEHGLPSVSNVWELDFMQSNLKISPSAPELEPGLQSIPGLYFVGHLNPCKGDATLPHSLAQWLSDHPAVFVYLSVKQFQPNYYIPVLREAFEGSEFRVVVAVGLPDLYPQLPENSANLWFERWINSEAMDSIADVVISAGTRGICWEAALRGTAHLAFPGNDHERNHCVSMMESAGAAKRLSDASFAPLSITQAVREALASDMKAHARALGDRLRSLGGPRYAAELLVGLAEGTLKIETH